MGALDNQPSNVNYLSGVAFRFILRRTPKTVYFCQSAILPGVSLGGVSVATPFGDIPQPGDKLVYNEMQIKFKVDENLGNWIELYDWMQGLGRPIDFEQTRKLVTSPVSQVFPDTREESVSRMKSDATLQILNSARNVNLNVFFYGCFPTSLSELMFDSTYQDAAYLESTVSFRYRRFEIQRI